jgi:hypothetical protein
MPADFCVITGALQLHCGDGIGCTPLPLIGFRTQPFSATR